MHIRSPKLHSLFTNGRKQAYAKGQVVQATDDRQKVLLLKSGFVKRYMISSDGTLGVQAVFGPGDIFPLTFVFKEILGQKIYAGPEVYYYETVTSCEIYSIDAQQLKDVVASDPLIYKDLFAEAGERLESNIQRLENLAMKTAYKRVAHQLLYFANKFGTSTVGGTRIALPLTQQDIANILSLTRETVSQAVTQLRTKKLIRTGRNIVVIKMDELEEEAFS